MAKHITESEWSIGSPDGKYIFEVWCGHELVCKIEPEGSDGRAVAEEIVKAHNGRLNLKELLS